MQKVHNIKDFIKAIADNPDVPNCIQRDVKRVFLKALRDHELELDSRIDYREYEVDRWAPATTASDLKLVQDIIAILEDMPECD